jgi:CopG antitoxin of type II toxin-antitoxin system
MPKLPEFKTAEELADFVDTHDTAPYWDDMTPVDATQFRLRRRSQTAVRVPMSQATVKRLKALAAERHVPLDDLLREWLSQRLQQEQHA